MLEHFMEGAMMKAQGNEVQHKRSSNHVGQGKQNVVDNFGRISKQSRLIPRQTVEVENGQIIEIVCSMKRYKCLHIFLYLRGHESMIRIFCDILTLEPPTKHSCKHTREDHRTKSIFENEIEKYHPHLFAFSAG